MDGDTGLYIDGKKYDPDNASHRSIWAEIESKDWLMRRLRLAIGPVHIRVSDRHLHVAWSNCWAKLERERA